MKFYSTNHQAPEVGLAEALLQGQAPDRGLYLPESYPTLHLKKLDHSKIIAPSVDTCSSKSARVKTRGSLSLEFLNELSGTDYPEVAFHVLRRFTQGVLNDAALRQFCEEAYDFDVPLEPVDGRQFLMRLDRGPTASFKDFAARMMARWMNELMEQSGKGLTMLVATSGDTGSAVAHAFHQLPRVRVVVLFPEKEVSDRQRKQMTTLGSNVTVLAVDGKFDDCQAMVKQAFTDPDLSRLNLTSANSINIGRLLPQCVYYVYAYVKLAQAECSDPMHGEPKYGEPMVVSIPSGNFGNMMGALTAKCMGLPIHRVVVATNANDAFLQFLQSGTYQKIVPSRVCISNAMNVGHPSNLARLIDLYGGWMDEMGELHKPPDMDRLRCDIYSVSVDDAATRQAIKDVYDRHGVMLEPHGAVGWLGLQRYFEDHPQDASRLAVCIETAHPAKFPDVIRSVLGIDPEIPPVLADMEEREERFEKIPCNHKAFNQLLLSILSKSEP